MALEPSVPKVRASAQDDVLASEAATYAFCAKAWHLEYVLCRLPAAGVVQRRSEGTKKHEEHGARVSEQQRSGPRLLIWSVALLVLAGVLVMFALLASS